MSFPPFHCEPCPGRGSSHLSSLTQFAIAVFFLFGGEGEPLRAAEEPVLPHHLDAARLPARLPGTLHVWARPAGAGTGAARAYDIDLFDAPKSTIDALHAKKRIVICYFSAGSHENWRPDAGSFPSSALGKARWRLIPFLFLLYIFAYLDRINIGFASLQMNAQLGFSAAVYVGMITRMRPRSAKVFSMRRK